MDHLNRYENKSIFYTRLSLVGNICWVSLKLILGFLVSYVFLASALFQIFIVISKAYLYFNIKAISEKTKRAPFSKNLYIK